MNTRDYIEEIAVRELETIFSSAEEFNKWYAEISANPELKGNWQKFCEWLSEIIEDIKKVFMSEGKKAELAELENIKGLLANAIKGAESAAQERASKVQAKQGAEAKSSTNLENQIKEEYNGSTSYSLYSYPKLNKSEWALLNDRLEIELHSSNNFIDDYTKWLYATKNKTRVFAIYGIGWGDDATPLYAVGGKKAENAYNKMKKFMEDEIDEFDGSRENFESWLNSYLVTKGTTSDNISDDGNRRASVEDGSIHSGQQASDGKRTDGGSTENSNGVSYSLKSTNLSNNDTKVRDGMSDEERYNIFVNKSIADVPKVNTEKLRIMGSKLTTPIDEIYRLKETERKKLFVKIGEEFGVFKNYTNEDIELDFEFSKGGMRESEQHQKGNYETFAKLFSCFDEVIERAIGIEVHNRNNEGYKVDVSLKEMYVLVSAFEDGENIIPVKLEIKEFNDKQNTLYIAVALESIKKNEVVKEGNTNNSVTQTSRSFNISLSQLLKNVNPKDEDFVKYIPKQFFDESIKQKANSSANHSLKGGIQTPSKWTKEFLDTVEDVRDGKKNAESRLYKYVEDGTLSTKDYDDLIEKYGAIPSGENPHREVQVPRKTAEAGIHLLPIFLLITAK